MAAVDVGLQYVTFFPTVTIAAIVAGYKGGFFATFIGMIFATYFFTPPYYSFTDEALKFASWGNLVFVLDGIILSLAIELMHRFRQNYHLKLIDAEDSERQVTVLNQRLSEHIIKLEVNQQVLRKYESIIESTNDAIIGKNLDGIIQSWNHGAEVLFGYTTAEVIGKPMTMLFPADRMDEESEILSRISQGEKVDHFETVRQCKDGSLIHISATISPIFDLQGRVVGVTKIARDITERIKQEDEIRQLAFYDPLTSLPNRRLLYGRLNQVLAARSLSDLGSNI
jgi:PAS domain S-box-containing protein